MSFLLPQKELSWFSQPVFYHNLYSHQLWYRMVTASGKKFSFPAILISTFSGKKKIYKVKGYYLENGNDCFYPLCLAVFEDGNCKSPYICISGKLLHGGLRRFLHCWFVRVVWNHAYFINSAIRQNKEATCFPSYLMVVFVRFIT